MRSNVVIPEDSGDDQEEYRMMKNATIALCDATAIDQEKKADFVPADEVDQIAALMLPKQLTKQPLALQRAEAEALFREGLRGATGRSLLARDIAAARAHLRYYTALLDHAIDKYERGNGSEKKVRLLGDLASRQHRMMTTSAELLLRLDSVPAATFRVEADAAAFVINDNGGRQNNG